MGLASTRRHRHSPFSRQAMRRAEHFDQPVDHSELTVSTTNLARRTRSSRRRLNERTELGDQVRYRPLGIEHQCPVHPADAEQAIGRIPGLRAADQVRPPAGTSLHRNRAHAPLRSFAQAQDLCVALAVRHPAAALIAAAPALDPTTSNARFTKTMRTPFQPAGNTKGLLVKLRLSADERLRDRPGAARQSARWTTAVDSRQ